jgi:hypothetical protein
MLRPCDYALESGIMLTACCRMTLKLTEAGTAVVVAIDVVVVVVAAAA